MRNSLTPDAVLNTLLSIQSWNSLVVRDASSKEEWYALWPVTPRAVWIMHCFRDCSFNSTPVCRSPYVQALDVLYCQLPYACLKFNAHSPQKTRHSKGLICLEFIISVAIPTFIQDRNWEIDLTISHCPYASLTFNRTLTPDHLFYYSNYWGASALWSFT